MNIVIKRAYVAADESDGQRILIDRLWPRGVSKAEAHIDLWPKELTPSTELRKWYAHDPERWAEFKQRYKAELACYPELIQQLQQMAQKQKISLITAAKSEQYNHALVLKQVIEAVK